MSQWSSMVLAGAATVGMTAVVSLVSAIVVRPPRPILPPVRVLGADVPGARVLEVQWDEAGCCWRATGVYADAIPVTFFAAAHHRLAPQRCSFGNDRVHVWHEGRRQGRPAHGERGWLERAPDAA